MKKLNVTFAETTDTTGYLFSLVKCLSAALRCGGYADLADDIVASTGFAFRMWIDAGSLCPSAASIWKFKKQKPWVENGGLLCGYVERLWGEDAAEAQRRAAAVEIIRTSIDHGTAAVAWDISGCEWGLIVGYDDEGETFHTLKISGAEDTVPYEKLGRLDLPILSVLTVTGRTEKSARQIAADTKRLAAAHLRGEEWCENAKGLAAYDALIDFIREKLTKDSAWNLTYALGTYAALKWYAWKFFEKYGEETPAALYRSIHESWQAAFDTARAGDVSDADTKAKIAAHLTAAKEAETRAAGVMAE